MRSAIISTALMFLMAVNIQSCDSTGRMQDFTAYRRCVIECDKQAKTNEYKLRQQWDQCNEAWEKIKDSCEALTGESSFPLSNPSAPHGVTIINVHNSIKCKIEKTEEYNQCKNTAYEEYLQLLRESEKCRAACENIFSKNPKQ